LPASRQPGDTGGGVDGVTRKILSPFLCRAEVKSNLDGEPKIIPAWQRVDMPAVGNTNMTSSPIF
jgi:hypothetical protein